MSKKMRKSQNTKASTRTPRAPFGRPALLFVASFTTMKCSVQRFQQVFFLAPPPSRDGVVLFSCRR